MLVTIWLIINELISILENLGSIGVPLPKFLLTIIKKLKTTTENKVESEDENGNWYEGMLAGDNIHQTEKGSNVIAAKMMAAFSEIY